MLHGSLVRLFEDRIHRGMMSRCMNLRARKRVPRDLMKREVTRIPAEIRQMLRRAARDKSMC